jgi:hypothetical protein
MIVISIPVKNHVKKYLMKRYGSVHQVTKKTFIGLLLLQLLEKKIDRQERLVDKSSIYDISVPEYYFNTKGYSVDPDKLRFLGICLEKLFMEDFYSFVDHELIKGTASAYKAIQLFFSIYGISENDLKVESMYRNYQRFSGENIKQKKQCKAVVN